MKKENPLVSIIVRTKDRPTLLKRALQSVSAQTYRPLEVILVNDGGCNLNVEELKTILRDVSLHYIRLEKSTGRPHAGNVGIENAEGDYIGFLDDDDIFYENHVETLQVTCAQQGAKVAYASVQSAFYNWIDSERSQFTRLSNSHLYNEEFNPSRLLFENYIPFNGLFFSIDVLSENKFDESLEINEDWDLLIRLSRNFHFVHVPEVTAEYSLFPKGEKRQDTAQIATDRKNIHTLWFKTVFDKHKALITGNDWYAFYSGYLIPKHERELQFLRDLIASEQTRLEGELIEKSAEIRPKDEELERIRAEIRQKDEELERIINSESWKITYPLRQLGKFIRFLIKVGKYVIRNRPATVFRRVVVELYHSPLVGSWLHFFPPSVKQKVKTWLLAREMSIPHPELLVTEPRVSIVIPVFNHAQYLDKCIKSTIDQDYQNLEIIIVDDASTDTRVKAILHKYTNNPRVKIFLNEKNMGISETQNRAIINSTGDIIAFLDCDDYLSEDAVSISMKHWNSSTIYLHTARTNIDKNERVVQRISFEHLPRTDYFAENLERMYATHFKLIRKDAFAKVGLFDSRFDSAQDYDMLMRIAFYYPSYSFVFVPHFVYFHRLHDRQETSRSEDTQSKNTSIIQNEARLRKNISEGIFDKEVSIIMLSYGKHEQTYEAIKSIIATVKIPFEIILFDNGSDNETVKFLKLELVGKYPSMKMIFNKSNLGPAEGRRQALKYAKGLYYIIFDNDEIAQPGWIEELLVRGETSKDIAAVVPRVFFPDNKLQFSGGGIRYIDNELIELIRYDVGKSRFDPSTALFRECLWVPIGATLFKVNPSPYLHSGYQNLFEDVGVSFALRKQGYRLVNAPGALVLHKHFMYMDKISMKKKYLEDRYNPDGMLRAIASFYAENNLILYDEYVWKENALGRLSREELKRRLRDVYDEIKNKL